MLGIALGAKLNANAEMPHRLDQIVGAEAPAVRFSISQKQCEPVPGSGEFVFDKTDALLTAVRARGLHVCLTLQGLLDGHALDPDHIASYAKFVTAATKRYDDPTLILGFENQNEVMLGHKYDTNPTPARYVPLQRAFYGACKASSPLPVGTSAIIGNKNWLEYCYDAGIKGYFDWVAYHPYTCHGEPPMSPTESLHAEQSGWWGMHLARVSMKENGDGSKKIWATEYGSPTGGRNPRSEAQQAADLTDAAHRFAKNAALEHLFWFDGWDTAPQTSDPGDWMGLYRADGTEKLSVATFRSLTTIV